MPFGDEVRRARQSAGLTVTQFAELMNVTQTRATRIEQMKSGQTPQRKTVESVAEALKLPLEKVMDWAYPVREPEDEHHPALVRMGRRIATSRAIMGLTQAEFADMLHIPRSSLATWEQGAAEPGVLAIYNISKALRVSIDILLGEDFGDPESLVNAMPATVKDVKQISDKLCHIEALLER